MVAKAKAPNGVFDGQQVKDYLGKWYDSQMSTALRKPQRPQETEKHGGTVFDIQPEMSSTKAVTVLLDLKQILGFEPSKDVIKKGGYKSKDEFVNALSNRVAQAFEKHYGAKPATAAKMIAKESDRHAQI